MRTNRDLNQEIESVTGIPDALCIDGLNMPHFGYDFENPSRNRLDALLGTERVDIERLELKRAIDFLMPSTTDFQRPWIGKKVAALVKSPDPKIVTLGCSTGLEVYWIIHYLRKNQHLTTNGLIHGVDINGRALEIARTGTYDKRFFDSSFFDTDPETRNALEVDDNTKTVRFNQKLLNHAKFSQANLLDLDSLVSLGLKNSEIVVLMNVLKYMRQDAQQQVLHNVAAILSKGGVLFTDVYTKEVVSEHPLFEPCDDNNFLFRHTSR